MAVALAANEKVRVGDVTAADISIREFRAQDQDRCCALFREGMFLEAEDTGRRELLTKYVEDNTCEGSDLWSIGEHYSAAKGRCFFVAEAPDGELAGMVAVETGRDGDSGILRRMQVSAKYRRRGVATRKNACSLRLVELRRSLICISVCVARVYVCVCVMWSGLGLRRNARCLTSIAFAQG